MTSEQLVLSAEEKIEELKQKYMDVLQPLAIEYNSSKVSPSADQLIECQRKGNTYFNYVENFVGNSGLLGAHVNGKWVTGFAETCHAVLESYILHIRFLRSHSSVLGSSYQEPNSQAYANMQRMTKEYLEKNIWKALEGKYEEHRLPVSGFKYSGASDLKKIPNWQLITGLTIGVLFLLVLFVLAVMIPNPTNWQAFIFRGGFAISLSAIAAIIPGLLTVESRFQKMSIRATGAIAVFVIVWLVNPPALIGS
ncbi:hypothetical protein KUL113_51000 [Tenacibaculum sp. KUL113]|nr:hypothetical protein KUL113_51000 [Tenacibaculum sp. KUL113]